MRRRPPTPNTDNPSDNPSFFRRRQNAAEEEAGPPLTLDQAFEAERQAIQLELQAIQLARQANFQEMQQLTINKIIENFQMIINIHTNLMRLHSPEEKEEYIKWLCDSTIRHLKEIIEENEYRLIEIKFPDLFSFLVVSLDGHLTPRIDRIHTVMAICRREITLEQIIKIHSEEYLNALCSPDGLLALKANIFNLDELKEMPFLCFLILLTPDVIQAMEKRWIRSEEVKDIPLNQLAILMTKPGLRALENRWITIQDVKELSSSEHLRALLTESGLEALKDRLIAISEVKIIPPYYLGILFRPCGQTALQERLVSAQEVSEMPSSRCLVSLLSSKGLSALRKNPQTGRPLITPKEASQLSSEYLNALLSKNGLKALKENLITVKDVIEDMMTVNDGIETSSLTPLVTLLEEGLTALQEGLITLKAARAMPFEELRRLLAEPGLTTLRARAQEVSPLLGLSENKNPDDPVSLPPSGQYRSRPA